MDIIKTIIGFVLGKSSDLGTVNRTAGVINYAWALPALGWVWFHRAETFTLQVVLSHNGKPETVSLFTATYLGASLTVGIIWGWIEFNRRAP